MKKISLSLIAAVGSAIFSVAQTTSATAPTMDCYSDGYMIVSVTPNGEYAVYTNRAEEDAVTNGGRIVNLKTKEVTYVTTDDNSTTYGSVVGITADGSKAVGTYKNKPAYWEMATRTWTTLPMYDTTQSGEVYAITPDGKYAVGQETLYGSEYYYRPVLWDLSANTIIDLDNVPNVNLNGEVVQDNRFKAISPDGRYVFGELSYTTFNYVTYYVYDRNTSSVDYIGFRRKEIDGKYYFGANVENLHHVDYLAYSPKGKYVTGTAYIVSDESTDDGVYAFLYNVETKTFEVYNDTDVDEGFRGFAVDDNGTIYGGTDDNEPTRDVYVRSGKYWYSLDKVFSSRYGIDILGVSGFDNSGTPTAVTSDGSYLGTQVNPSTGSGINYTFNEDIHTACKSVDLMSTYKFSPSSEVAFSQLGNIVITFDRDIKLVGDNQEAVQLLNSKGEEVDTSVGITISGSQATIQFFPQYLEVGETYTVRIPAGTFSMKNDDDVVNREITATYYGRAAQPIEYGKIYPANNTQVSKFDATSSYLTVSFDAYIKLVDDKATAKVYRNDEEEPYETFALYTVGNTLVAYPITTVYFFKDNTYRIVIPAGVVTDLGGGEESLNKEIVLNYDGGYEREISSDDKVLFSDDFSSGLSNFMMYEGDALNPSDEMQGYNFTKTTTPWQYAGDSEEDPYMAAMSHSSYETPGQSDDWLVTPAIYLPDETCYLQFKGQGFRKNKQDRLHVYVIPSETNYNTISNAAITEFKANRELVFDEVLDPGENEETLAGDWTSYNVSLAKYAGQQVYIAFVNENYDQSIVFIDDVEVVHEMRYLVSLDNETTVVAQDEIDIFGSIAVDAEGVSYTGAHLELYDTNGDLLDTIDESNVTLDSNNSYSFRFSKPLPLEIGVENEFKIKVQLGNETNTFKRTITNVAFNTTRRVVLEEYAGATCKNCPLGNLAIEKLQKELPDNFIAISIRTYGNDPLSYGLDSYVTYLGLEGAPRANIDRKYTGVAPMTQISATEYGYSAPAGESPLWRDVVYSELAIPAIADINITAAKNETTGKINSQVSIKYALDKSNVNAKVFFVVLEDNLLTSQSNAFYNSIADGLGEWGKNGFYGSQGKTAYDVPANDVARAIITELNSYNGTAGFVDSSVKAGDEYVTDFAFEVPTRVEDLSNARLVAILIDDNTDQVINANQCKIELPDGVNDVLISGANATVSVANGNIIVKADAQSNVTVYNVAGTAIANANGQGEISVSANGYAGVALVRVTSANGTTVQKVVVK